jgi:hypothetical protein
MDQAAEVDELGRGHGWRLAPDHDVSDRRTARAKTKTPGRKDASRREDDLGMPSIAAAYDA